MEVRITHCVIWLIWNWIVIIIFYHLIDFKLKVYLKLKVQGHLNLHLNLNVQGHWNWIWNWRYKDIVPFDANRVPVQPYKVDGDREVRFIKCCLYIHISSFFINLFNFTSRKSQLPLISCYVIASTTDVYHFQASDYINASFIPDQLTGYPRKYIAAQVRKYLINIWQLGQILIVRNIWLLRLRNMKLLMLKSKTCQIDVQHF